jgi:hypothetical protein
MKLLHGYTDTELDSVVATTENMLTLIRGRALTELMPKDNITTTVTAAGQGKTDEIYHAVTAAELEALNTNFRVAAEFIKAVKKINSDRLHESMQLGEKIVHALDLEAKPYVYATSVWSKSNLEQYDEFTRASIKRILREYFSKVDLAYEGWN